MPWKCPECGVDNNVEGSGTCGSCGELTIRPIFLIAEATAKRLPIHIDTDIGRRVLASLGDEDARFASEPQFLIAKSKELGGWSVTSSLGAKNPTFLNGAEVLSGPQKLDPGAILSIGRDKMKMRVEIGDAGGDAA